MSMTQQEFYSSSFNSPPVRPSPTRSDMYPVPDTLSPTQLEAQRLLSHLLGTLKKPDSRYHARYAHWLERHSKLEEFLISCIRPEVWRFLATGTRDTDALKLIGGDLRFGGKAVYLNGVLGLDRRVRVYVGQSGNLRVRVAQHLNFRHRRDHPSLHYHAMQYSIFNVFGVLAVLPSPGLGNQMLPGMDRPDLLLNLLEMWMCLVFRSLPDEMLAKWLPDGVRMGGEGGRGMLNIASPLDQGEKEREWLDLSTIDDALVQGYLEAERTRSHAGYAHVQKATTETQKSEQTEDKAKSTVESKYRLWDEATGSSRLLLLVTVAVITGITILKSKPGTALRITRGTIC